MIRRLRAVGTNDAHKTVDTLTPEDLDAYADDPAGFEFDAGNASVQTIATAYRAIRIWEDTGRGYDNLDFRAMSDVQSARLLGIVASIVSRATEAKRLAQDNRAILRVLRARSAENVVKHVNSWVKPGPAGEITDWADVLRGLPDKVERATVGTVPRVEDTDVELVLAESEEILGFARRTTEQHGSDVHKQVNTGLAKAGKSLEQVRKSLEAHGGDVEKVAKAKDLERRVADAVRRAVTLSNVDFQSCDSAQIGLTNQLGRIRGKFDKPSVDKKTDDGSL